MNDEFSRLYRYLTGIEGPEALKAYYDRHLAERRFPQAGQTGFSGHVAAFALKGGSWRLKIADVWTRLFDKNNLIRHKLNLVVALAECGPGFPASGAKETAPVTAWFDIAKLMARYAALLAVSVLSIGGLYLSFHWRKS